MSTMLWHPETGESRIFGDNDPRPLDWIGHHPSDPAYAPVAPPPPKFTDAGLSRGEVVAALTEGRVPFDARARTSTLTELLGKAVRKALADRGVAYDAEAHLRDLLALLRAA